MKIIITALASLALAGSAFAALPAMSVEKKAGAKANYRIELANGGARVTGYSTEGNKNTHTPPGKSRHFD